MVERCEHCVVEQPWDESKTAPCLGLEDNAPDWVVPNFGTHSARQYCLRGCHPLGTDIPAVAESRVVRREWRADLWTADDEWATYRLHPWLVRP